MTEVEAIEVEKMILDSFDAEEFDMFLASCLGRPREMIVADGPFKKVVHEVVRHCRRLGIGALLVADMAAARPMREDVQALYHKLADPLVDEPRRQAVKEAREAEQERYRALAGARVKDPAPAVVQVPPPAAGAGSGWKAARDMGIPMSSVPHLDCHMWLSHMAELEAKVCRIEIDGLGTGTGFLVAPDLILTTFHRVEELSPDDDGGRVVARFDYQITPQGPAPGRAVPAAGSGWLVAWGPYTTGEMQGHADHREPTDEEADFALIRLSTAAGHEPRHPDLPGCGPRGWIRLPAEAPMLRKNDPLMMLGHPMNAPLKLALDTLSVIDPESYWSSKRLRYRMLTYPGCSGAPVFDLHGQLVAVHQTSDGILPGAVSRFKQGVAIAAIMKRLEALGLAGLVAAPPP